MGQGEVVVGAFDVSHAGERAQLEAFVEDYRRAVEALLAGVTEEQARRRLVQFATTLLGLVKHVTWMQRVWFEEGVGGTPRSELALVENVGDSFLVLPGDTIASVLDAHRSACATARGAAAGLGLDSVITGHASGPAPCGGS